MKGAGASYGSRLSEIIFILIAGIASYIWSMGTMYLATSTSDGGDGW